MENSTNVTGLALNFALVKTAIVSVSFIYLLLFFLGICGNMWVGYMIWNIFRGFRNLSGNPMLLYVLSLSIVDSLVLILVPFLAVKNILDKWVFGLAMCKIYFGLESLNKILSTFILVGLSCDRYLAVCHPWKPKLRSIRVIVMYVFLSAAFAGSLQLPLFIRAKIEPYKDKKLCVFQFSRSLETAFFTYTFIVAFLIPVTLIAFFYTAILLRLSGHIRNVGQMTNISLKKVTVSSLFVVAFYYACWIPYWTYMLLMITLPRRPVTNTGVLLGLCIHSLPYTNSALNWIFYAYLNRSLRDTAYAAAERRSTRQKQEDDARLANQEILLKNQHEEVLLM